MALYSQHIKFDDTLTMMNFLCAKHDIKKHLKVVEISTYKKQNVQTALKMLIGCQNLAKLHISQNVNLNSSPTAAAKTFKKDAYDFMFYLCTSRGNKESALSIIQFGKSAKCFAIKTPSGPRAWSAEERASFDSELLELMR